MSLTNKDRFGWDFQDIEMLSKKERGGKGSGNFSVDKGGTHYGRPGQVGGSSTLSPLPNRPKTGYKNLRPRTGKDSNQWGRPSKYIQEMTDEEYLEYLKANKIRMDYKDPRVQQCLSIYKKYGIPAEEFDSFQGIEFEKLPIAIGEWRPNMTIVIDPKTMQIDDHALEFTLIHELGHHNSYYTIRDERSSDFWSNLVYLQQDINDMSKAKTLKYGLRPFSGTDVDELCADIYAALHFAGPEVKNLEALLKDYEIDPNLLFKCLD